MYLGFVERSTRADNFKNTLSEIKTLKYYKNISNSFELTDKDVDNITSLQDIMANHRKEFIEEYTARMLSRFNMPDKIKAMVKEKHGELMGEWYDRLFEANVNSRYTNFLYKIGKTHVSHKVDKDWANSMLSYARLWIHEKIFQNIDDDYRRKGILLSVHKLLDINHDIINHSYYDCEISKYTKIPSFKNIMVTISERFSFLMHVILVTVLIGLTFTAAGAFIMDLFHLIGKAVSKGDIPANYALISALGSLLIIWVLVELLHTEVQIMKGGQFKISVFIGVALIAFIRDLLIITLKHSGDHMTYIFVLSSILILGVIYWLIVRTEKL